MLANVRLLVARVGFRALLAAWSRMPQRERDWLLYSTLSDHYAPSSRRAAGLFLQAIETWKRPWEHRGRRYNASMNGEEEVLRRLSAFPVTTVFDVGANVGTWMERAHRLFPRATIHAFEITPATARACAERAGGLGERVVVNGVGLSDQPGRIRLFCDPEQPWMNTTLPPDRSSLGQNETLAAERAREEEGEVITGDGYVARHGIERIDLLKIDVEGGEGRVLDGFRDTLTQGRVTAIQLEYNPNAVLSGFLLHAVYRRLEPLGYAIGRIQPEGVAFKPYDIADEDFIGPNVMAVQACRPDIIAALRCDPLTPL